MPTLTALLSPPLRRTALVGTALVGNDALDKTALDKTALDKLAFAPKPPKRKRAR